MHTNNSLNNGLNCLSAKIQSCNPRNWQNSKSQDCTKRFCWILSEKSAHNKRFTKKNLNIMYEALQLLTNSHAYTHTHILRRCFYESHALITQSIERPLKKQPNQKIQSNLKHASAYNNQKNTPRGQTHSTTG